MISTEIFKFLKTLAANNTREWFSDNKAQYDSSKKQVISLVKELETQLNIHDVIEEHKIFRINRDVRFSKDKSPYKTNISGYFRRAGASRRGSYYFSIAPGGQTMVGGGFYAPNKEDLFRIRKEFEIDVTEIEKITSDKNFVSHFGKLQGAVLKSAPRDFDKSHPNIKWINMKQFYAFRSFSDKEVISYSFTKEVMDTFSAIRPFFDFMSDVLTTDLNGESVL